ncbi:MAG TPA: HAMP domain-containing histidine kinase [Candidatus Hydrogenedentes bacterium]|nr:HAMP domain-containing histidine kinase [Candidatus Hydrogenedentota bacterium]
MMLLLLAVVIAPTVCVLWFMLEAVSNERLAVRERLKAHYDARLADVASDLDAHWATRLDFLADEHVPVEQRVASKDPRLHFTEKVLANACDTAIICQDGRALYPLPASGLVLSQGAAATWVRAEQLEFGHAEYAQAATVYAQAARESDDAAIEAKALLAQARCLGKSGDKQGALAVLLGPLASERLRFARDERGAYVAAGAALYALKLLGVPAEAVRASWRNTDLDTTLDELQRQPEPEAAMSKVTLKRLWFLLDGYHEAPPMPLSQRVFLMGELMARLPAAVNFDTYAGEELALRYFESNSLTNVAERLTKSSLAGFWHVAKPTIYGYDTVAVFRESRVIEEAESVARERFREKDVAVRCLPSAVATESSDSVARASAGRYLGTWDLAVFLEGPNPFETAARRQIAVYVWTGLLVILVIVIVFALVAHHLMRQLRLTNLKNELIATVSHELKTPLASSRVLVDTLLEGRCKGPEEEREYLELVANENARLSGLIDNFLMFSRMERNKQAFVFEEVRVEDIVHTAIAAAGERFRKPGCTLEIDLAPDIPQIQADRDALVTVLVNLLDNAYKYSEGYKRIALKAYAAGQDVCFEVIDNGIGMSRRAAKKAFQRFYQADRRLSRSTGGCGLGLSIVQFIVKAHGGAADVKSEPGKGSTFTVRLPIGSAAA